MDALAHRRIDEGDGTAEAEWLEWLSARDIEAIGVEQLLGPTSRAVVVAPHPDDEILAVGGLVAQLALLGREIQVFAVTDGEASHPGSALWTPQQLKARRIEETRLALSVLGVTRAPVRLHYCDGTLAIAVGSLAASVRQLLQPSDVVFTTWRFDGHPDHEATARACMQAAAAVGARLVEVPVWAWHWAATGEQRFPWERARVFRLSDESHARKADALQVFRSQLLPDPSTGAGPVLRSSTVQRACRPFELFFI